MSSPDRILAGRRAHLPGEPWAGAAIRRGPMLAGSTARESAAEAFAEAAAAARLDEIARLAEERGYADGHARASAELGAAIAAAGTLARSLETAVPRDVDMVARTLAELSILVARRILGAELRHDPAVLIAAIEAGLRQAVGASSVQVELHPDAVGAVEAAWVARHGLRHRGLSWSFAADPTLTTGGCRLRTEHGLVEAGFEDQLTEIATAMDAAIPGYLKAALGAVADAEAAPAGSADLAILASSPADRVHPGASRRAAEGVEAEA